MLNVKILGTMRANSPTGSWAFVYYSQGSDPNIGGVGGTAMH